MISFRKYVDRAGNVAWHLSKDIQRCVLRFTAAQVRDEREKVARTLVRTRNQLKVVQPVSRLSRADILKEFGR